MEAKTPLPCWCAYQRFKKSWLPQRRLEDLWPPSVEPASKLSCLGFTFSRHSCLQHRLQPLMQKFSVNPDVYFVTSLKISYFEADSSQSHQRVLLDEFVFCAVTPFFQQNLVCPKFEKRHFHPLQPNVSIHILLTLFYTFSLVLTRRICLTITAF